MVGRQDRRSSPLILDVIPMSCDGPTDQAIHDSPPCLQGPVSLWDAFVRAQDASNSSADGFAEHDHLHLTLPRPRTVPDPCPSKARFS